MKERLADYIKKQEEEIKKKQKEIDKIKELEALFPDLDYAIDRWKNFRLRSKTANEMTNDVALGHSCGCCADAALLARPFVDINGNRIYSEPETFTVGEKAYGGGEHAFPGWRTEMLEKGIPKAVIEKVENYLEANKPVDLDEEDDDWI